MTMSSQNGLSRRALLGAFAATAVVAAPTYSNAAGFLRGAGDVRRIAMYSGRTGESINTIYWIEGDYIKEALGEINYFMRDWRTDEQKVMDSRTVDIAAAAHSLLDSSEPYMLLSGYRSPATNNMFERCCEELASHGGPSRRPAAAIALGQPDLQGRFGL
jgi:uncharacterized protein YcbK (DUF882 family)